MIVNLLLVLFLGTLVSSRELGYAKNSDQGQQKQLFVSRRVVTDYGVIDGGVLVTEDGIIESVLTRDAVDLIISSDYDKINVIDGGSLALMPGVIDTHVHVNEPGRTSWEGYVTATQAAAAGGVTTIFDMPLNSVPPTTTLENLKTKVNIAREEVYVDVGFWGGVIPGNQLELRDMIRAGVVGFKCFIEDSGVSEFPMVNATDIKIAFDHLNGTNTVFAFHAEKGSNSSTECDYTDEETLSASCPDPSLFSTYLATHPPELEIEAVSLVTSFVSHYDVHVHIVHVSAEGVVPLVERARQLRVAAGYRGWRGGVTAETCNHYLTLAAEEIPPGQTQYKCSPPVRERANKQKLWEYIDENRLDLITSDHSPSTANLKTSSFMTAWGGISSMQFDLPLFWTQASARGHDLLKVTHFLSHGPAQLVGLQERKGAIRPGLDADLIFFDSEAVFLVTPDVIKYKNKISPYMDRVLRGKVVQTYLRGELIYADGELVGGPKGKLLINEDYLD